MENTRYRSFARRATPLYTYASLVLVVQTVAIWGHIPVWIGTLPMLCILGYAAGRGFWWFHNRDRPVTQAKRRQRVAFETWSLLVACILLGATDIVQCALLPADMRDYLVLHIVLVSTSSAFFLLHLQRSALALVLVGSVSASVCLILSETPIAPIVIVFLLTNLACLQRNLRTYGHEIALGVARVIASDDERARLTEENIRLASIDPVTGLPNRRRFFTDLERAFDRNAGEAAAPVCIAIMDLDGFKTVNDTYGHSVGDRVLEIVAGRLRAALPAGTPLYRLGGDEFVAFIDAGLETDALARLGDEAIHAIEQPMQFSTLSTSVGCSIGIARSPRDADTAVTLFECADYALYHAKYEQRGHTVIFAPEHAERMRAQSRIEHELRVADLETELYLVFQPIVDSHTGRTIALESLARWSSPALGEVPPSAFIPVAERAGLIASLTDILLRKTLDGIARWPDDLRVSFNLSASDIGNAARVERLIGIVAESGVAPGRIEMEMTETALLNHYEDARAGIDRLHQAGLRVALDDFGAGFSSLNHVNQLPLDNLKIDGTFAADIEGSIRSRKIVKMLTDMCRDLEIDCIVEGVETERQLAILRGLGCRIIQGFHYGRPARHPVVEMAAAAHSPR